MFCISFSSIGAHELEGRLEEIAAELAMTRRLAKERELFHKHPNIVNILEVTEKNAPQPVYIPKFDVFSKIHYIVQDFCEGGDFYQYLQTLNSFPEEHARFLVLIPSIDMRIRYLYISIQSISREMAHCYTDVYIFFIDQCFFVTTRTLCFLLLFLGTFSTS